MMNPTRLAFVLSVLALPPAARGVPPAVVGPEDDWVGAGHGAELAVEAKNCGDFAIVLPNGVILEMVGIEPGSFKMGSPEGELGREDGERPHGVTLSHGFWLGKYEVTQEQYEALTGKNPSPGLMAGTNRPVTCVVWAEARSFCARLTDREKRAGRLPEGYVYSLPTEAQWEYACRAGTESALNSGANLTNVSHDPAADAVAWYGGNAQWPQEVGTKSENAWGLFDMHGNVAEWCADGPWEYPRDGEEQTDPAGAARNGEYMVRGGSWKSDAGGVRSANREKHGWRTAEDDIGFRVALVPTLDREFPIGEGERIEMVWCPPGSFEMGSPDFATDREPVGAGKETQHDVTLTHGFWIGKYEVTQAQYEALMMSNPSGVQGADLPVETVSWRDATNFLARLTAAGEAAGWIPAGWEFALPTEAQWEYACWATAMQTTTVYEDPYNGRYLLAEVGWYCGNSDAGGGDKRPHPVGQLLPNAWGTFDMHGNVAEWCADWYEEEIAAGNAVDPAGPSAPGESPKRVIRGGSWNDDAVYCRTAVRSGADPDRRDGKIGFRVALVKKSDGAADPDWTPWQGLECQWFKDGAALDGATGTVYRIASMSDADAGRYWLVAANGFGSATSRVAAVALETRPCEDVDGVRWYYEEGPDGGATVTGASPAAGELEMPATLGGLTVTAVGDEAFRGCEHLEGMALADGVAAIGDRAFAACTRLAWMDFPDGLKSIGKMAFAGSGLEAAVLPGLETVGTGTFKGCGRLTECSTGGALESVPPQMFEGCLNLLSFAVADAATNIGARAFASCGSMTNLYIGSNVVSVAPQAIVICGALATVQAPIGLKATGWTLQQQLGNATVQYYGNQTVTFDAAGGTCELATKTYDVQGKYDSLPVPEKDGNVFFGWLAENGNRVKEGDAVAEEAAMTLTADWREGTAQVVDGVTWASVANADGVGATVTGAEPLEGVVAMPAELGGLRVTGIASNAFAGCRALQAMRIPAGVVEVGTNAFAGCRQLQTLTAPDFLAGDAGNWGDEMAAVNIETYAAQLAEFNADGGTCPVARAGYEVAEPYGWLPEATMAGGKCLGWVDSESGEQVAEDSAVTAAATRTLRAKWAPAETVDGVTWFYTLETGGAVVWGAEPAQGWMRMPDTLGGSDVLGVGEGAFAGCTNLHGMSMPQTVRLVGDGAFAGCTSLKSIRLPDAAAEVGVGAFQGCTALSSAWIGTETVKVGANAFAGCTALQVVWLHSDWYGRTGTLLGSAAVRDGVEYRYYGAWTDNAGEVVWYYWSHADGVATIMGASPAEGQMALPNTVGGDLAVTAVGPEAFWECDGLTGMAIGPGVTNIGSFAFGRSGLESVTLPDTLQELGEGAFHGCGALAEAKLGGGLAVIPQGAFESCSNLASVAFGENVREIGTGSFFSCTALKEVVLPAGLASIGESAFEGCTTLTNLVLSEGVTDIGPYAFTRCEKLERVALPASLKGIGEGAFYRTGLTEVAVPGSVSEIGPYAFSDCPALAKATLGDGLPAVGMAMFSLCPALTEIEIPDSVADLRTWAFYGCSNLTGVAMSQNATNIGYGAFSYTAVTNAWTPDGMRTIGDDVYWGCADLRSVRIGSGVESVGAEAFGACPALLEVWVHARWEGTDFLDGTWGENGAPKPDAVVIRYYGGAPCSVSNIVARQRWPWNGLVDVDYEIGGEEATLAGLAVRISFEEQGGAGRTWVATNFLGNVAPSAEPGPHRATWDTKAAGVTNVVAAEVVATVELVEE